MGKCILGRKRIFAVDTVCGGNAKGNTSSSSLSSSSRAAGQSVVRCEGVVVAV